jgi:hypothetical protein
MSQHIAQVSTIIASAHLKIASIHMDLVNQLQQTLFENNRAQTQIYPPSPGLSEATTQKIVSDDDDFADSPILSNANALLRAQSKLKIPVAKRMKLNKEPSDTSNRIRKPVAFLVFQAENRLKVFTFLTKISLIHTVIADERKQPATELQRAVEGTRSSGKICFICVH